MLVIKVLIYCLVIFVLIKLVSLVLRNAYKGGHIPYSKSSSKTLFCLLLVWGIKGLCLFYVYDPIDVTSKLTMLFVVILFIPFEFILSLLGMYLSKKNDVVIELWIFTLALIFTLLSIPLFYLLK